MIHLILVSHHPDIARGIAALAVQMSAAPDTIHTAAGIDDADNPVGTDAVRIMQAILEADNPDGILILVDLGSAILSAQTALDLLDDPALAARCRISPAPLVEGAISAAVAASSGADLASVAREAEQALAAKQAALGTDAPCPALAAAAPQGDSASITLANRDGLHARPAARLAAALAPYQSRLVLTCGDKQADATSLNQLALLQARCGDHLTLYADGDDAASALQAFRDLAAANFGDPADERDGKRIARANPASAARIRAAVWRCEPPQHDGNALHAERDRFRVVVASVAARLASLQAEVSARLGAEAGEIFAAQQLLFAELVEATLASSAANLAPVWQAETSRAAAELAALSDPYLRARAADIHDLAQQVLALLAEASEAVAPADAPFVLIARDLYPSRAATLPANCLAVVLAAGDARSHAALLCQAAQRPWFGGAGDTVLALQDGQFIEIERDSGEIFRV